MTSKEYEKCKKDIIVFDGNDCIEKMMVSLSGLKGEPRKVVTKIVKYNMQLIEHNGSGFDICVVLNKLSNWYRIVNIIKNGKGIISLKVFNRNVKISEKNMFLSISHLDVE